MEQSNRIDWVDLLKGIAILWLVVYHMYIFEWMRSPVPVFFFLSGLFFYEGRSFRSFVRKKAKALLVPLLFFFVLGIVASSLKCFLQGDNFSFPPLWLFFTLIPIDSDISNPLGVGALWFLVSLFEVYVIYYLLRLLSRKSWWLLIAAVLLFLISCIALQYYAHGSLFYMFYTFGFCIYFIVAHIFREKILYGKVPVWLLICGVVAYLAKFIDMDNLLTINRIGGGILLRVRSLTSMTGLLIIFVWLCKNLLFCEKIANSFINKLMLFEGRNSLTILGTHLLAMGVSGTILKHYITEGALYYIMLFIIVVAISNICVFLFNRFLPFLVNHK